MGWTYSNAPATVARDEVRLLVGDTDSTDQLVSDEEITWALAQGPTLLAASRIAEAIAGRYSRRSDKAVGQLSVSASQRAKAYLELAKRLQLRANLAAGSPYAGGISIADKLSQESDTDRVSGSSVGMHDNPYGATGPLTTKVWVGVGGT